LPQKLLIDNGILLNCQIFPDNSPEIKEILYLKHLSQAETEKMKFFSRKLVKPHDLNSRGTLFGGILLGWIDEEAAIFVMGQLKTKSVVTKYMSEINFISSAQNGDIVEIGMEVVSIGRTSITVRCVVRNKITQVEIIRIEKIVFVHVDAYGKPVPHGIIREV